ncbi:MAG TPA: NADH-ubiquinone oxidoreductase-F iron-sulfur binding region domain-containing protein [Bacillota bacterium]|nr:NADH-ubiquinone oxidoreductase-F iron-sulfur binding region domain-containing protein [Bacillota bacterium]HPL54172.1 NADH-ubiquinone oxidoreductase-F iron-sulfur binding region domain-containing protein [Bacillota bacterium]
MAKIVKLISKNFGNITPGSVEDYVKAGGYAGLRKAMQMDPQKIIEEVKKSNLMGRGGAGYPTGVKWEQAYANPNKPEYVVCNGDEGEPGTYKDRFILSKDPLRLIEGMTIAAYVFKIKEGYIYVRGEYLGLQDIINGAIKNAEKANYLGDNILGSDFSFHIQVVWGAGAYVCGENTALLESIEGKSGRPRKKPPYLTHVGLHQAPTLLQNVETYSNISYIVEHGGEEYASYGTKYSGGTKLVCLSGNVVNRGVYEIPFGTPIREILYEIGGGIPNGRKLKFVQLGGSSGACFKDDKLDTPMCYKALRDNRLKLGSGALLVVDDSNCVIDFLKCITEFFIHESCGKCTPCREGNTRIYETIDKFSKGEAKLEDLSTLSRLSEVMKNASFCGLGQAATTALTDCMKYMKDEFLEHIDGHCRAGICSMFSEEE